MDDKAILKLNIPQVPYHYKVYGAVLQNVERLILCSIQVVLSSFYHAFVVLQRLTIYLNEFPIRRITACQIMENVKDLKKSPKHIVVVVNEEDIFLQDIANLLVWIMFSGISHVTICDRKGKLFLKDF